jgi:GT2 family glycosyltransferase
VEKNFEYVNVIRSTNTGYGAGNNLGVDRASGTYVVILNPDTVVEKDWLANLISPLQNDQNLVTTSKILLYDGVSINTCGNINHFTGLTFTNGLGKDVTHFNHSFSPTGISGACFAMKKEDFLKIGGFDETFFLYNEDSEFSWRLHSHDFCVLVVPDSLVKHDYELGVSSEKLYFLETGRYRILRKYFNKKEFLLLFPSLIIAELLVTGYALKSGNKALSAKFRALKDIRLISRESRHQDSCKILTSLSPVIPVDHLTSNKFECTFISICNMIFTWNMKIIKKFY